MLHHTPAGQRASSPGGGPAGDPGGPGGPGREMSITAGAIGIDEAALAAALAEGQTIADVAQANGVKPRQVVRALVSDVVASVAEDIRRGDLSADQVSWLVALATWHAEQQVTRAFPAMDDVVPHGAGWRPLGAGATDKRRTNDQGPAAG